MKKKHPATLPTQVALAASLAALPMHSAWAQDAVQSAGGNGLNLDEMVITATPVARSKMKQSLSVSDLDGEQIRDAMPASSAEILRSIPGVRSESSSGEGNANVTVRGLPISAGGSRYVQFQEDGLPVLLNGDYNFLTPDVYIRADMGTEGVEVVRGGSASTMATNAPGGVINFISKTGEVQGGSIGLTTNAGGSSSRRIDLNYGVRLSDTSTFNISGFARDGQGPRATQGVNMEGGGQIRLALNKDLGGGNSVKIYAKFLDDTTPLIMDTPVRIQNGQIVQLNGVNPGTFSPYASGLPRIPSWGLYGSGPGNMNDGLHATAKALGAEVNLDLGGGWRLNDKFRISSNGGSFNGIMPAAYGANNNLPNPSSDNPSRYQALFLGSRFNDASLAVNDLKATRIFGLSDDARLTSTLGLFMASQKLDMDWEIGGFNSGLPVNGSTAYGPYSSFYQRNLNETFNSVAPYLALGYEKGPLNIDGSFRSDRQNVNGSWQDSGAKSSMGVSYHSNLDSYSLGANYSLNKNLAVFGRVSRGGALPSDRILAYSPSCGTHCLIGVNQEPNTVTQYEGGVKWRDGNLSTFVTLFQAKTDERNYDVTTGVYSANKYDSKGIELEAAYRMGNFRVNGGLTLTHARVTDSNIAGYAGLTPNRQAKAIYQLAPSYQFGPATVGATIIGTTSSQDGQTTPLQATLPSYTYVNAFARYEVNASTTVALGVNNLFNTLGYTEINTDRAAARSITARTVRLSLRYNF